MKQIFELSKEYGNPIGAGGNKTWYTGSFDTVENQQVYDLKTVSVVESGSFATDKFTLRKLFYLRAPASLRFYGEAYGGMFPSHDTIWLSTRLVVGRHGSTQFGTGARPVNLSPAECEPTGGSGFYNYHLGCLGWRKLAIIKSTIVDLGLIVQIVHSSTLYRNLLFGGLADRL